MTNTTTLNEKYLTILENHGWSVIGYYDDGRIEIGKYSPAGEDFSICVEVNNFPESVSERAVNFDIDEHIEMWIEANHNGVTGVPSTHELVQDAENIAEMLHELVYALTYKNKNMLNIKDTDRILCNKYKYLSQCEDFKLLLAYYPDEQLEDFECVIREYEESERSKENFEKQTGRGWADIIGWYEGTMTTEQLFDFEEAY